MGAINNKIIKDKTVNIKNARFLDFKEFIILIPTLTDV